jgi:hypothetical protein
MINPMTEDVIRLCQGGDVIAVANLDGTIVECNSFGVERSFGLKSVDVLSKNILTLLDNTLDQMEFQKLIKAGVRSDGKEEKSCLLRAKETRSFIWADRRPPDGISCEGILPLAGLQPRMAGLQPRKEVSHSPVLVEVPSPSGSRKKVNNDKMYQALDTTDMSFNDVFEETDSVFSNSNRTTPSASEQSLLTLSDVGSGSGTHLGGTVVGTAAAVGTTTAGIASAAAITNSAGNTSSGSIRGLESTEDESNWGWFMTVSPSSSTNFSNITSQIRIL